ncbi:MAG: SDR family NAD(P)-dependent oxidoreductase [Planctomycetota bacterium]|nr:SDR family NAD(P)-dependent oxidoreductase [Planctomycetota bacterium]
MKAVLLGATNGLGRALAQEMASRGAQLCLLGRNLQALEKSAKDLEIRGAGGSVATVPCDLLNRECFDRALQDADAALEGFDTVVVTAGVFGTQDELEADLERASDLLMTNFTNTVMFCELARKQLLKRGGGTLCVFSSVAGDRGRKPAVLYGATKAGISHYMEGLDHRYHEEGLSAVLVKPGFVKTSMTAGMKPSLFAAEPASVARTVLNAIHKGKPVVYVPGVWSLVMLVIRWLPRFVMRRVGF